MCCPGQTQLDVGQLVVRPMHRSHTFEAALLLTEAFLGERRPPSFPWMLCAPPTCSYFQGLCPTPGLALLALVHASRGFLKCIKHAWMASSSMGVCHRPRW